MTQQPYPYGGTPAQQYPAQQYPQSARPAPVDANALLMGGNSGAPALKVGPGKIGQPAHTQPHEMVGGRVVSPPKPFTVMDNQTKRPKLYPSGDPIQGVCVEVQTGQIDPTIEGDRGVRTVYIEGAWRDEYHSRKRAVTEAIRAAGSDGLHVGDELYLGWTHTVDTGAPSPAVNYVARYVRGSQVAANAALQPPQAAPAPQPYGQPAPQAAPAYPTAQPYPPQQAPAYPQQAQPPAGLTPEQAAALAALGATPATQGPAF